MISAAGVDTWSPAWYLQEGSGAERAMRALATQPVARGAALPETVLGHRVGWFPSSRLLWAEGHPGGAGALGLASDLPAVLTELEDAISDLGIPVPRRTTLSLWRGDQTADRLPGRAGIRRLDLTVDRAHESTSDGVALLAGVSALAVPRAKTSTWRAPGARQVETVGIYGYSGKKLLGRVYDAGVRHGTAARGQLVRFEDQRRWTKDQRRGVEELTATYCREKHRQRFKPLWEATRGVTVTGPAILAAKLQDAVEAGDARPQERDQLIGHAVASSVGLPATSRWTRQRREARLRELGLVLNDGSFDDVEVDLHQVLEECMETGAWEAAG